MPIVREFKGPREYVEVNRPVEVDHAAAHPGLLFVSCFGANAWIVTRPEIPRDRFPSAAAASPLKRSLAGRPESPLFSGVFGLVGEPQGE
jgi:hypothetical protein